MALFQKKPLATSSTPLYTTGASKTLLVVGLGNPGKEYELTRHNIGFICVDAFAEANNLGGWVHKKDLKCLLSSGTLGENRVIVIKPQTFMNLSGEAVSAVMQFYKIPTSSVLVISDELDIPFGQIRLRMGGGSAGHKGIKSIIQHCGDNSARIRVGIKTEGDSRETSDFVLSKFSAEEQSHLPDLKREVISVLTEWVYGVADLQHETRSFLL